MQTLIDLGIHGLCAMANRAASIPAMPQSLWNCHLPGLASLVLGWSAPECLLRAYVAPPGRLHPWLSTADSAFLWHPHAYDFESTTLVGDVTNIVASWTDGLIGAPWFDLHEHEVGGTAKGRSVRRVGRRLSARVSRIDHCGPGQPRPSRPDRAPDLADQHHQPAGLGAWLEDDSMHGRGVELIGLTERLEELPGAADLYRPMTRDDVASLCDEMLSEIVG